MSFFLVSAPQGTLLQNITNGATINLAKLPTRSLSINVVPSAAVGSLKIQHNGHVQVENGAPYALAGDTNGAFNPANLSVGTHTVVATPYSQANLGGTAGTSTSVSFSVVDKPGKNPKLLTHSTSDHAVAFNAATFVREPFSLFTEQNFSFDKRTRLVLFVTELQCNTSGTLVTAKNSVFGPISLPIEHIGRVPGFDWLTQIQVVLPDSLQNIGDVWLTVSCDGFESNQGRLKIKQSSIAADFGPSDMDLLVDSPMALNFRLLWLIATRSRPGS